MKRLISLLLASTLLFCLASCSLPTVEQPDNTTSNEINNGGNASPMNANNVGFSNYDSALISYVSKDFSNKNFSISPLSFKYALALAIYGANGETQTELLNAIGIKNISELDLWVANMQKELNKFETSAAYKNNSKRYNALATNTPEDQDVLEVANSVWHNTDQPGTIKKDYITRISSVLNGFAENIPGSQMTDRINDWANEKTRGLIKNIVDETAKNMNTILVNSVYMKNSWKNQFDEAMTKEKDFTTITGEIVQKEMMQQTNKFQYYEDDNSKLLIMPMEHNVNFAFVIGDKNNISDKIANAKYEEVSVMLPKFDIDTSFEKKELVNFLIDNNVSLAFSEASDFSNMIDGASIKISDIVQKTNVKIDENGAEAAAVTAIMMETNGMIMEPQIIKEFHADKPFSFYIYIDGELEDDILFFGQIVE